MQGKLSATFTTAEFKNEVAKPEKRIWITLKEFELNRYASAGQRVTGVNPTAVARGCWPVCVSILRSILRLSSLYAVSRSEVLKRILSGARVYHNLTILVQNLDADQSLGKVFLRSDTHHPFGCSQDLGAAIIILREAVFDKQV